MIVRMSAATPLPRMGDVFFDARGSGRALRLSRHPDAGVVVLSIWNGGVCQATFRLPTGEVGGFVDALTRTAGIADEFAGPPTRYSDPVPGGQPLFPQTGQYEAPPTIP
jgi:hypothetical protein